MNVFMSSLGPVLASALVVHLFCHSVFMPVLGLAELKVKVNHLLFFGGLYIGFVLLWIFFFFFLGGG